MYVAFGGAVGSMLRYALADAIARYNTSDFPYGTFAVNLLGGLLMGAWIATVAFMMPAKARDLHLLLAVGLLGGFTTFSAFSLDIFLLLERGLNMQAVLYIAGSVVLSVLALLLGMMLVKATFG